MKTMMLIAGAAIAAALGCNNNGSNAGGTENKNAPSPQANAAADQTANEVHTTGGTVTNATNADPLSVADNADKIRRTGVEQKLVPTTERITVDQITLRDAPRGASLGMAKAGDSVTEVAREGRYLLVLTPDPSNKDKQMAAWIYDDAVMNPSTITERPGGKNAKGTSDEKKPQCAKGELGIRTDHDFCAKACKTDGDCASNADAAKAKNANAANANAGGDVCDGNGLQIVGNGHDTPVKYCVGASEHAIGGASNATPGVQNNHAPRSSPSNR